MGSVKLMARAIIKGYNFLIKGSNTIPADDEDKIKKEFSGHNLFNFTAYSELILAQEEKICFHIIEEAKKIKSVRRCKTSVDKTFQNN